MRLRLLSPILLVIILSACLPAAGQLNVTSSNNALTLARKILGPGVTILNPQFTGHALSAGTFTAAPGSFLLDSGIVLSSGRAKTEAGGFGVNAPGSSFASTSWNTAGNADLGLYASPNGVPLNTLDACVLEFDFIPQGDSIYVRYIFGSEEYPDYNCANVNDAFAFIISGPGIFGKKNIAIVPNAVANAIVPVAINSINNGIPAGPIANCWAYGIGSPYTQYYVDNAASTSMVYDGHTVILTAKAKVIPCQTYHIKLAISDVGDRIFDSGVFLEASSFISKKYFDVEVNPQYTDATGKATLIEGCKNSEVKIKRAAEITGPFEVYVTYGGTATATTDYTPIPSPIVFLATDTVKTFTISAPVDALSEGTEKAVIYLSRYASCNYQQSSDSAILYIRDSLVYRNSHDTSFCTATPISVSAHDPEASTTNSYQWSHGATTQTTTITQPGTYTAVHTWSQRCFNVDTFRVISNDPAMALSSSSPGICPGDTATLTVTTAASNIAWNNGATTNSIKVTAAGDYWVTVTGPQGCAGVDTITVLASPAPVVNLGADTSICGDADVVLDAWSAGATYLWSTGSTDSTITVDSTGTYSVISTLNGCSAVDTIQVSVNPVPVVNLGADTAICGNASVQLDATFSGASHTWNTGAITPTLTVTTGGSFSVINTLNGCTAKDTINIAIDPVPVVNLGADKSICEDQATSLDATYAGASYVWSTGATSSSITVNTAGAYSVVSTVGNCSATDTVNVAVTPLPVVDLGADTSICAGNTLQLNAAYTGASHAWSTGASSPSINVSTAGSYSVINSLNGCTARDTINVAIDPVPVANLGTDRSICQGETAQLDATYGGASYVWSTGATSATIMVSAAGNYSVVSTIGNCSATDTVAVAVNPLPIINLGADTAICADKTLQLNATYAGASHAWNNGASTPSITVSNAGTYSVINSLNGCTARDTINVTVKPVPVVNLGADTGFCQGGSAQLNANYPGATQVWSTGATSSMITVNTSGNYSVINTLNGCTATDAIVVNVKPLPFLKLPDDTSICENTALELNAAVAGVPLRFVWNTGDTTATLLVTTGGTYSVTSNLDGCMARDTINIMVQPAPVLDLGPDQSMCTYDSVLLNAAFTGATYSWNTGATTATIMARTSGMYTVTSSISGCASRDSVNIIYKKMPLANAGADLVIAQYDSVQLNASTHPDNLAYLWTPAGSLNNAMIRNPVATPSIATLYTVRVTSVDGCILEDAVMVNIQFPMHAPNAFSPNGDNINDKWRVTNLEFNPKARVHVYDRYGRLVFLSQGTSAQWDGTNKGKPMPPATYYYIIDVGNGEKLTGWVLLVR